MNRAVLELAGGGIDFTAGALPHLTLYMGLFPDTVADDLRAAVEALAREYSPVPLAFQGFSASREGHLFLDLEPAPGLVAIHRAAVEALNPFRQGAIREKYLAGLAGFPPAEQHHIRTYGYPWVLDGFRPHVTIGFVSPGEGAPTRASRLPGGPPALLDRLGPGRFGGVGEELGLGPVGEHGAVIPRRGEPGKPASAAFRFPLTGTRKPTPCPEE